MMRFLLVLTFFPVAVLAFTLNLTGKGFSKNEIDIHIANTDCSNAGFSTERFRDLIEDAVNDYWNGVASANLKLKVKAIGNIDVSGMTHQEILDSDMIAPNSILAGCNEAGFNSANTLGGAQNECDGDTCRSIFLINARSDSAVPSVDNSQKIATIAHELGHSIGLGHSQYSHNLMYYKIGGKTQEWLGDDDIRGVTYLYPHEPAGGCDFLPLFGSMGLIRDITKDDAKDDDDFPGAGGASALAGLLISFIAAYLLRCLSSFPSKWKTTSLSS